MNPISKKKGPFNSIFSKETHPQCTIPTSSAKGHPITTDTKATNPVFMPGKYTDTLSLKRIPNIACPVIIATE